MVAIAESISKPAVSRFRFILDRRDVLGSLMVAPAILYVLLLVGVPFLMAVYYSVSAYTIYNPSWQFVGLSNFVDILENPSFRQTLYNTFIFTFGSQFLGLILGKFGALVLLRPFPGRKFVRALVILPWAVPVALAVLIELAQRDVAHRIRMVFAGPDAFVCDVRWRKLRRDDL